jgi:predicted nucleic acid-binding protein
MTLVDSNVLLDVLTDDPIWFAWSTHHLDTASVLGPMFINDVIYAELSVRFAELSHLEMFLRTMRMTRRPVPGAALFLAGKVFQSYRQAGGIRTGVLPDFFIGAQASVENIPLMTRDRRRYSTYFPKLQLISPVH